VCKESKYEGKGKKTSLRCARKKELKQKKKKTTPSILNYKTSKQKRKKNLSRELSNEFKL
jgi:hypothetical protein